MVTKDSLLIEQLCTILILCKLLFCRLIFEMQNPGKNIFCIEYPLVYKYLKRRNMKVDEPKSPLSSVITNARTEGNRLLKTKSVIQ